MLSPSVFFLFFVISSSQGAVDDYSVISWNMQSDSCGASTLSKWMKVKQMILDGAQIIALQEAGSINDVPSKIPVPLVFVLNPDRMNTSVSGYKWNITSSNASKVAYIYFLNIDTRFNRDNLAFVTIFPETQLIILRQPTTSLTRPAFGFVHQNNIFFNVHAMASTGGYDAPALISRIYNYTGSSYLLSWMILGTFNQEPSVLEERIRTRFPNISRNVTIVAQNHATYRRGGNIDYAVVRQRPAKMFPVLLDTSFITLYSDHIPIFFPSCGVNILNLRKNNN